MGYLQNKWVAVALACLLPPVGIYLLVRYSHFSPVIRVLVVAILALLMMSSGHKGLMAFLIIAVLAAIYLNNKSKKVTEKPVYKQPMYDYEAICANNRKEKSKDEGWRKSVIPVDNSDAGMEDILSVSPVEHGAGIEDMLSDWERSIHCDPDQQRRMDRARMPETTAKEVDFDKQRAFFLGRADELYETFLTRCSCMDFSKRGLPCKHMYRLAITLLGEECAVGMNKNKLKNFKEFTKKTLAELDEASRLYIFYFLGALTYPQQGTVGKEGVCVGFFPAVEAA